MERTVAGLPELLRARKEVTADMGRALAHVLAAEDNRDEDGRDHFTGMERVIYQQAVTDLAAADQRLAAVDQCIASRLNVGRPRRRIRDHLSGWVNIVRGSADHVR